MDSSTLDDDKDKDLGSLKKSDIGTIGRNATSYQILIDNEKPL